MHSVDGFVSCKTHFHYSNPKLINKDAKSNFTKSFSVPADRREERREEGREERGSCYVSAQKAWSLNVLASLR